MQCVCVCVRPRPGATYSLACLTNAASVLDDWTVPSSASAIFVTPNAEHTSSATPAREAHRKPIAACEACIDAPAMDEAAQMPTRRKPIAAPTTLAVERASSAASSACACSFAASVAAAITEATVAPAPACFARADSSSPPTLATAHRGVRAVERASRWETTAKMPHAQERIAPEPHSRKTCCRHMLSPSAQPSRDVHRRWLEVSQRWPRRIHTSQLSSDQSAMAA